MISSFELADFTDENSLFKTVLCLPMPSLSRGISTTRHRCIIEDLMQTGSLRSTDTSGIRFLAHALYFKANRD